jgi:hypothetical protein
MGKGGRRPFSICVHLREFFYPQISQIYTDEDNPMRGHPVGAWTLEKRSPGSDVLPSICGNLRNLRMNLFIRSG